MGGDQTLGRFPTCVDRKGFVNLTIFANLYLLTEHESPDKKSAEISLLIKNKTLKLE